MAEAEVEEVLLARQKRPVELRQPHWNILMFTLTVLQCSRLTLTGVTLTGVVRLQIAQGVDVDEEVDRGQGVGEEHHQSRLPLSAPEELLEAT